MFYNFYTAISDYVMGRPEYGMDFSVGGYQISGSSSANLILSAKKDGSWSKIVISYIVTSRNDFFLGSFTISSQQFQPLGNNQYTYGHSLVYWSSFGSNSISRLTFLESELYQVNLQLLELIAPESINLQANCSYFHYYV